MLLNCIEFIPIYYLILYFDLLCSPHHTMKKKARAYALKTFHKHAKFCFFVPHFLFIIMFYKNYRKKTEEIKIGDKLMLKNGA